MSLLTDLLQRALRLESRSFLVYVREAAAPRTEEWDVQVQQALQQIIAHEESYLDAILNLLEQYGLSPDLATAFDIESTGYHYLELDYLIQVVERKLARLLDAFRAIYDQVADLDAGAAGVLQQIARGKQQDLALIQRFHDEVRTKHGTARVEGNRTVGRD